MTSNTQNENAATGDVAPETANGTTPGETASSEIAREAAQIAALQAELADFKDRYLRAVADTENLRKRAEREKQDATQYAFSRFARELLSVADNFERALEVMKPERRAGLAPEVLSVLEGIEATQRQLLSAFERFSIRRIEAVGQKFNPNQHEAIAELPVPGQAAGSVIAVAENGYMIGERLLRAAKVAIAAQMPEDATRGTPSAPTGGTIDTSA
ncbi:MAG: nucleotide exchange factor GrpE [Alphaproteobacteria bacterium]|nr:nucleotide exchange factor GrpE [Alphaproteobacteria bacterium]